MFIVNNCHKENNKPVLCNRTPLPLFVAILLFLSVFLILYFTVGVFYLSNDDTGIMKTFSGYCTGEPNAYHPYGSYTLGLINVFFYNLFPKLNWYSYGSIFIMIISNAIITTSIFYSLNEDNQHKIKYIFLIGIIAVAVNFYGIKRLSWTLNGLFAALAGLFLLLIYLFDNKHKLWKIVLSALLFGIGAIIRDSSFEAVVPYAVLCLLYYFLQRIEKPLFSKKNTRIFITSISVLAVLCFIWNYHHIDNAMKKSALTEVTTTSQESDLFERYRGLYNDSYHIPYKGNEEFYESIGWDEELYELTENWFSMDERFNTENLKLIYEKSNQSINNNTKVSKFSFYNEVFWAYTQSDPIRLFLTIVILLVFFAGAISVFYKFLKHKYWQDSFLLCSSAALAIAEWLWLIIGIGRFIDRAFYCATIPALFIIIWIAAKNYKKISKNNFLNIVATVFSIVFLCMAATFWIVEDKRQNIKHLSQVSAEADMITASNPDYLYITDLTIADGCNLFLNMNMNGYPNNQLLYGGTGIYSKSYYDIVSRYGFEDFYSDDLFSDNVLFMTTDNNLSSSLFMDYMHKCYGNDISVVLIDQSQSGVCVYKFIK